MFTDQILSGWMRRTIALLALMPVLAQAGPASAQTGAVEPVAGKYYTNERVFDLPISIDPAAVASTREVQLFMKVAGNDWQPQQVAAPWQKSFKFKAPADGEYWFTLATINKKGEQLPPEFSRLGPNAIVMVVIDTQAPSFDLQPARAANGDILVRCIINDANPDYKSIKIACQGPDQSAYFLEPVPGQPGTFRAPNVEIFAAPLRVTAVDLARNPGSRTFNLQESVAKLAPASQPPTIVQTNSQAPQLGGGVPNPMNSGVVQSIATNNQPSLPAAESKPVQGSGVPAVAPPADPRPVQTTPVQTAPVQSNAQIIETRPPTTPVAANPGNASPQRQLINTTRASLDYRIEQVGPSGVGKVEVWMTADQGTSWKRLCEDVDRRTPAEFDLPGDGQYGVRVIVTNGNGFGGKPPAPGEQPQLWLEVDTIAPSVHLKEVEPTTNGGTLDIRWTASDKNLGAEPIHLYYSTRREGPWLPIARNLKNDGLYRWAFPRDAGAQFFVRIEAADTAGNLARSDSPNAIVLDMTEPRVSVVGVTGVQPPSPNKSGN